MSDELLPPAVTLDQKIGALRVMALLASVAGDKGAPLDVAAVRRHHANGTAPYSDEEIEVGGAMVVGGGGSL
jgi:hypothetical protein